MANAISRQINSSSVAGWLKRRLKRGGNNVKRENDTVHTQWHIRGGGGMAASWLKHRQLGGEANDNKLACQRRNQWRKSVAARLGNQ